jgi:hypothetical protein
VHGIKTAAARHAVAIVTETGASARWKRVPLAVVNPVICLSRLVATHSARPWNSEDTFTQSKRVKPPQGIVTHELVQRQFCPDSVP